jgi:predicted molibdopterin-dependent oxidoreductase YjgC
VDEGETARPPAQPLIQPLIQRIAAFDGPTVTFLLDGAPLEARAGESVLTAVLAHSDHLRRHEVTGEKRAGFCLMGACQDCWVWFGPAARGRACTTLVEDGMQVFTTAPHG